MTRETRTFFALASSVLTACGAPAASPASGEALVETSCAARVADLSAQLAAISPGASRTAPDDVLLSTTSAGAPHVDLVPIGAIHADGSLLVDGRPVADAAAFAAELDGLVRNWGILHPRAPAPERVGLYVDRRAPVAQLHRLAEGLAPRPVVLLLRDATQPPPPACPASLGAACSELATGPTPERAAATSRQLPHVHGDCAPMIAMYGGLGRHVDDLQAYLRSEAPRALEACGCASGVVVDGYVHLTLLMAGALDPWIREVPLPTIASADDTSNVGDWLDRTLAARDE